MSNLIINATDNVSSSPHQSCRFHWFTDRPISSLTFNDVFFSKHFFKSKKNFSFSIFFFEKKFSKGKKLFHRGSSSRRLRSSWFSSVTDRQESTFDRFNCNDVSANNFRKIFVSNFSFSRDLPLFLELGESK